MTLSTSDPLVLILIVLLIICALVWLVRRIR